MSGRCGEATGRTLALTALVGLDVEYRELARFADIRNAVTLQFLGATGCRCRTRATTLATTPTASTTTTTTRLGAGACFLGALRLGGRRGRGGVVLRGFHARLGRGATALRAVLRLAPRTIAAGSFW